MAVRKLLFSLLAVVCVLAAAGLFLAHAASHRAKLPAGEVLQQLAKNHEGPGPCLRWPNLDVMPDGVTDAAHALRGLGFDPQFFSQVGYMWVVWGRDREAKAHRLSAADEMEDLMSDNLWDSLMAKLGRGAIEDLLASDGYSRHAPQAQILFHQLTPESQTTLRALFVAHPSLGTVRGVIEVMKALNELQTDAALSHGDGPERMHAPPSKNTVVPASAHVQPH